MLLFNPAVSESLKEISITKLITSGIVSQYLGNLVTFESWNDAWIFKGLSRFLEFEINTGQEGFSSSDLFISEILHPVLKRQSFSFNLPPTTDDALSEEVAERGKKNK